MTLFEESIRSKYTKRNYHSHLNHFMKFMKAGSTDDVLMLSPSELQRGVEDYLMALKSTSNPNSVPSMFRGIRHFCIMNEIGLNWNKIYKMFPPKQKTQSMRSYTASEIRRMLSVEKNARNKALIHFLASTGARIGVFDHPMLIKHMQTMPCRCSAVLLYAGDVEEYWSFLTPQATKILKAYHDYRRQKGEVFGDDAPMFGTDKAVQGQLGWSGARSVIYRAISKSGIARLKQGGRYDVQADHGFRKRFNTILKLDNSINYNIAEKLMGHKNGLDGTYLTPTLEEMFSEFRKVMRKIQV